MNALRTVVTLRFRLSRRWRAPLLAEWSKATACGDRKGAIMGQIQCRGYSDESDLPDQDDEHSERKHVEEHNPHDESEDTPGDDSEDSKGEDEEPRRD
jgi:hypothetical protein